MIWIPDIFSQNHQEILAASFRFTCKFLASSITAVRSAGATLLFFFASNLAHDREWASLGAFRVESMYSFNLTSGKLFSIGKPRTEGNSTSPWKISYCIKRHLIKCDFNRCLNKISSIKFNWCTILYNAQRWENSFPLCGMSFG